MATMSLLTLTLALLKYSLGVFLIASGAAVYLVSRLKLLVVNCFLQRPLDVLSGADALNLYSSTPHFTQPECPMVIHAAMVLKGRLEVARLRQHVQERLVDARDATTGLWLHPRLRQRPVRRFGYFVWEDEDSFDVRHHFRLSDQPYADEASMVKLIESAAHTPLPEGRPMWEILVIPKMATPGADDECSVLLRVHHCMGDGVNLIALVDSLWDTPILTVQGIFKTRDINLSAQLAQYNPLLRYLANRKHKWSVSEISEVISNVANIGLTAPWFIVQLFLRKPERNSIHGPTLSGRRLMALSKVANFQLLKDISTNLDCRISDVFNYCLIKAIHRCNKDAFDLTGISSDEHVTFFEPMYLLNARSGWTQNGFAPIFLCNSFQEESPQKHIRNIAAVANDIKHSAWPLLVFTVGQLLGNHLPLALAKTFLVPCLEFSAMVTNVVGFSRDVDILGLKVAKIFFLPASCTANAGVSVALMSYKGCFHLGVTVDRAVAPDDRIAQRLADDWINELHILHAVLTKDVNAM